ncbi:MAG: DUF3445 domain-containing protein [Acidimicrobiales bacterium]|nr:DUF3445 domain-containing protein [Acidimicrobiales bacterium]
MPLSFADVVPVALFPAQGFRWRLATRGLSADAWLQFDDTCTTYLAEKCRVLQEHRDDALAVVPGSEVAAVELADLVAEALTAAGRQLPPDRAEQHPIEWAARGVQEDLCLLERDDAGWRFTAAAVCFPTRWSPAEKVGLELRAVHDPVPRYDDIAETVDRFFDRLRPGALAWRPNWSLVGDDRLRLPVDDRQAPAEVVDPVGELWMRVERQTIRRLVDHPNAAVFTIRVHRWPLTDVLDDVDTGLAHELRTMPSDVADYKNVEEWRSRLVATLARRSSGR